MNSKQLKLLVIIFVCIGVVGYLLVTQNNKSWSQGEQAIGGKVMPDFPMNDVTQIAVKSNVGEATLVKVDETWRVSDRANYAADFSKIRELLHFGKNKEELGVVLDAHDFSTQLISHFHSG